MLENKPIALLTGLPGSGKTAFGVLFLQKAQAEGRPIFQTGIPELKLDYSPVPPISEWTELRPDPDNPDVLCPFFTFPERSIIFLSEAQRWFRPRASGSKVPDHVAAFETTRHTGVTFVFDTQHPDFIDSHVRKLVGQHIHLLDHGIIGRWHYEWPYCSRPEDFKNAPIKKPYKLPKQVFGLYKSASTHIKRKYTIPLWVYILLGLFSFGGYSYWSWIQRHPDIVQPDAPPKVAAGGLAASAGSVVASVASAVLPKTAEDYLTEKIPVYPGRPETAPMYASLLEVRNVPRVVGCIDTVKRCKCINQQGTDAGLDNVQCRTWLNSPPFDPYTEQKAVELASVPPSKEPQPSKTSAQDPEDRFSTDHQTTPPAPIQPAGAAP